jgi:NADH:ubiquinone oxidoreductase subunit 2 (subunit N)
LVAAIFAVTSLLGWVYYLRFCKWLVHYSRDSSSLRDAALVARAFRAAVPMAVAQGLARLADVLRHLGGP